MPSSMVKAGSKWWPTRGFLAGIAATAPFMANPVSNLAVVILVLPLLIDLAVRGVRLRPFLQLTPILLVIYVLAAMHLAAIGTKPYWTSV